LEDDTDRADGVVVAWNREIDFGRIGVGIDDGDDRDAEATSFGDGDGLASRVNDDDGVRFFLKVANAAKVAEEFFAFTAEGGEFLFGHGFEFRLFLDVFEVTKAFNGFANGGGVGEHAAEPTVVDVVLSGCFCSFADGVLCLAFAADEKDLFVFADEVGKEVGCFIELLDSFLEVDDVDSAFVLHKEGLHAWIPLFRLVTVVNASVYHFSDEFVNHDICNVCPVLNQSERF